MGDLVEHAVALAALHGDRSAEVLVDGLNADFSLPSTTLSVSAALRDLLSDGFILFDGGLGEANFSNLSSGAASSSGGAALAPPKLTWTPTAVAVLSLAGLAGVAWRLRKRLGFEEEDEAADSSSNASHADLIDCSSDGEGGTAQGGAAEEKDEGETSSANEQDEGANCVSQRALQVAFLIVMWWGASIYVTFMVKLTAVGSAPHPMIYGTDEGPSPAQVPPFLMTAMVNVVTGIFSWCIAKFVYLRRAPLPRPTNQELRQILILGVMGGCEIGSLNKSLQYITISERTMLQNSSILLMMLSAQVLGLEGLTFLRIVAGLLLVAGGICQGLASSRKSETQQSSVQDAEHLRGLAFMLTSLLVTSLKWNLVQCMTQRNDKLSYLGQISKLQLVALVQPLTGLVCFWLALYFEWNAITTAGTWHSPLLWRLPPIAVGIVIITGSELKLVQLTSAVATGVLMNLHHIPMVFVGVLCFSDQVSFTSICGFALCLLGGCAYAAARSYDGLGGH